MADRQSSSRAFVLGIDGVPWSLVDRWTAAGDLPNFARLREEGAAGPLESTTPPTTPLAWPSIATGVWPDQHGIYGFRRLTDRHTHAVNTSDDVASATLWDVLGPAAVGNVPMTYPAREIDGRLVTGMMTPDGADGFTHPPELADRIEAQIPDYQVGLEWAEYRERPEALPGAIADLVAARQELLDLLLSAVDWRLAFVVFTAPDRLQHLIWDESVLLDHYRTLDAVVGDAMERAAAADATLYVVSDHGFGPIHDLVNVNRILEREGHLTRRDHDGTRGLLSTLGLTKERVRSTVEGVGLDFAALVRHLPDSLVDRAATRLPGSNVLYDIDHSASAACVFGPGNVYVNDTDRFQDGVVEPEAVDAVKADVAAAFRHVTDPETGQRVLDVHDGDDLFPRDPDSPDLVVRGKDGYSKRRSLADATIEPAAGEAAGHRSTGVFLAWGPHVAAGSTPAEASVVDVAPTVLHLAGEPVPASADGRVLSELFEPDSPPAEREVSESVYDRAGRTVEPSESGSGDVEDRLRGLGYID